MCVITLWNIFDKGKCQYICVCIYIITREIGKFNTGNYEIRELLYVNMKNIRKC